MRERGREEDSDSALNNTKNGLKEQKKAVEVKHAPNRDETTRRPAEQYSKRRLLVV